MRRARRQLWCLRQGFPVWCSDEITAADIESSVLGRFVRYEAPKSLCQRCGEGEILVCLSLPHVNLIEMLRHPLTPGAIQFLSQH